jgi:hypothetical protein
VPDGYGIPTTIVLLHGGGQDVPKPLRELKHLHINVFPSYVRQRVMQVRKK